MIQMNHCFMADVFRCLRCIHCVCQEVAVDSSLVRELCDCCLPSAAFTVSSDQLQSCCLSRTVDTSRANKVPCGVFPESSARNRKHHHNLSNLQQEKKKKSSFSRCRSTSRHLGLICFLDKVDVYFKASRGVRLTGKQRCEDLLFNLVWQLWMQHGFSLLLCFHVTPFHWAQWKWMSLIFHSIKSIKHQQKNLYFGTGLLLFHLAICQDETLALFQPLNWFTLC